MMVAFVSAILQLIRIYEFIVLARVLMSWFPLDRSNPTVNNIVGFLYDVTEPALAPIRNALPPMGGMDFSPIVLFIGLQVLSSVVVGILL